MDCRRGFAAGPVAGGFVCPLPSPTIYPITSALSRSVLSRSVLSRSVLFRSVLLPPFPPHPHFIRFRSRCVLSRPVPFRPVLPSSVLSFCARSHWSRSSSWFRRRGSLQNGTRPPCIKYRCGCPHSYVRGNCGAFRKWGWRCGIAVIPTGDRRVFAARLRSERFQNRASCPSS